MIFVIFARHQILRPIVRLVPVDVVYFCFGGKGLAYRFLDYQQMLKNKPPVCAWMPVLTNLDIAQVVLYYSFFFPQRMIFPASLMSENEPMGNAFYISPLTVGLTRGVRLLPTAALTQTWNIHRLFHYRVPSVAGGTYMTKPGRFPLIFRGFLALCRDENNAAKFSQSISAWLLGSSVIVLEATSLSVGSVFALIGLLLRRGHQRGCLISALVVGDGGRQRGNTFKDAACRNTKSRRNLVNVALNVPLITDDAIEIGGIDTRFSCEVFLCPPSFCKQDLDTPFLNLLT